MPLRIFPSAHVSGTRIPPATRLHCQSRIRVFHSTPAQHAHETTHYETLGVAPGASQSDIKKQYYKLSKSTHPDRNPNDPTAAARFSAVSDAYAVLGHADKRARYDRDVMRTQPQVARQGSHSSAQPGPYGGRSASGLSKRKSPFRGPPRSFYESGGYGKYGDRRAAEAEATASNARRRTEYQDPAGTAGGFSPGQGAQRGFDDDVPHFDREGHYKTQETVTGRFAGRQRVREEDLQYATAAGSRAFPAFLLVSAVVGVGITVPILFSGWTGGGNGKDKYR